MKNFKWILIMILALAMIMSGCAGGGSNADDTSAGDDVNTEAAENEGDTEGGINEAYAQAIEMYITAFNEQWGEGEYLENGMSSSAAYYYEGTPLENAGYALIDLDNDGSEELLIGAISNAESDPVVFEMWTMVDGQAKQLFTSHPRNRYCLEWGEEDVYMIANEGNNGAANSAYHYYILEDGQLKVVQGIVFDALEDEANPWYMTYDDNWDVSDDEQIDEETAIAVIEAHANTYTVPEYTPFSQYTK